MTRCDPDNEGHSSDPRRRPAAIMATAGAGAEAFRLTERHKREFRTLGYTVFERIIPPELIVRLRAVCPAITVQAFHFKPLCRCASTRRRRRDTTNAGNGNCQEG